MSTPRPVESLYHKDPPCDKTFQSARSDGNGLRQLPTLSLVSEFTHSCLVWWYVFKNNARLTD